MKKMNMFISLGVLLVLLLSGTVMANQVIVVNDSIEKIYTIEKMALSGDLAKDTLSLKGSGNIISGNNVKVYLFGPAKDILISGFEVDKKEVPLSFDEKGYFFVGNEGDFAFSANVKFTTIGQIKLYMPGPVNLFEFGLENGYAIDGDKYGLHEDYVIIQRDKEIPLLVDGAFRFSYANQNQFYYVINIKSFGGSLGKYTLGLLNNEQVSNVFGAIKWVQEGNELLLDLEGSSATLIVEGIFDSGELNVTLKSGKHHVLVEADNEYKIVIGTSAREIDISEAKISPTYPNARAFVAASYEPITVQVEELKMLPSLSAAVDNAYSNFAITEEGSILGDLNYNYKNTGVDYIDVELDKNAVPLYAGADGRAVKLTKDESLKIAFPKSQYGANFELLYFTTRKPLGMLSLINIPVAKTDLPISTYSTNIYLPKEYFVINTFGADGGSEMPDFANIIVFIVLVGGISLFIIKSMKFSALYLLFNAGLLYFDTRLFAVSLILSGVLILKKYISKKSLMWALAGAGVLVLVVAAGFVFVSSMGKVTRESGSVGIEYSAADVTQAAVPAMKSFGRIGVDEEGAISVPQKTGVLPVKMQIPRLGKSIRVTNYLVTKEMPLELKVLVIAGWLKYVFYIIALACGALAAIIYRNEKAKDNDPSKKNR